ncbi:hypothetical protein [Phyllobacterium leguminum]|uniref:hypothetical protein n=1 Tax=Phyllobacterium leguminum TaxID=314237 RepID=UPI0011B3BA47|nr:hypothetical protein [Phyllobacterium leguminum]
MAGEATVRVAIDVDNAAARPFAAGLAADEGTEDDDAGDLDIGITDAPTEATAALAFAAADLAASAIDLPAGARSGVTFADATLAEAPAGVLAVALDLAPDFCEAATGGAAYFAALAAAPALGA